MRLIRTNFMNDKKWVSRKECPLPFNNSTPTTGGLLMTRPTTLLFLTLTGLGTFFQSATQAAPRAKKYLETGGERKLDITYKKVGKHELKLDLYYPTPRRSPKCPVVFYTHGGGWAAGSRFSAYRGSFAKVFSALIKNGFAVAPVDYRLAKKNSGVAMRDCVTDCKDAMRFLAKNADRFGIDPMKFYVMGDSAGGHLAQMLLFSPPDTFSGDPSLAGVQYKMVAGVSWYGPCDFENIQLFNHDNRKNFRDRFVWRIMQSDTGPRDKTARYREISPINYLKPDSPPLLMIQGDKDTTIPVKQAYYMAERNKTIKAPVEIVIVKNAGHNWRSVGAPIEPSREEIEQITIRFFLSHR
ncbi:MAG: alpha/beta hydrolase [Lentisphaerae bacterium]|nr:MAG: alpha/beta hydrolase [Lentisphaerota bacterium]